MLSALAITGFRVIGLQVKAGDLKAWQCHGVCLAQAVFPALWQGSIPVNCTREKQAGVETTFWCKSGSLTRAVPRFHFSPQD